jgi:hypothetical protein
MPLITDSLYDTVVKISQGDLGLFKQSTEDLLEAATGTRRAEGTTYIGQKENWIQTEELFDEGSESIAAPLTR